jgi:hypothetical protein
LRVLRDHEQRDLSEIWPVKTGKIDLEALRRDRDRLWAEAAQIEAQDATLKLPEALWSTAAAEQDRRRDQDPWDEMLAGVKGFDLPDGTGREERISTTELLTLHLRLSADKCNDAAAKRLGYCMVRLGWEKPDNPIRILASRSGASGDAWQQPETKWPLAGRGGTPGTALPYSFTRSSAPRRRPPAALETALDTRGSNRLCPAIRARDLPRLA